jgi:hypothetical protein
MAKWALSVRYATTESFKGAFLGFGGGIEKKTCTRNKK